MNIPARQITALIGPSGCGKSTILRTIGGFLDVTDGDILIDNESIVKLPPEKRPTAMVFQSYNLWTHMTVYENLAFGLKLRKIPKDQIRADIDKHLKLVSMSGFEKKYPTQLSGGQQQRIAIARSLLLKPSVLLLDEPFSALDAKIRQQMREELKKIQAELGITVVFVTHDQEEATEVADRVVVMSQGNIEQAEAPDQVWREPATRFVLEFMGEVNRLQGTIRGGQFHVGAHRWPLGYTPAYQGPVDLFLRPWEVDISRRTSLDSPLPVQVLEASPKGHYTQLVVQPLGWYNEPLTVVMHGDDAPQRGERLFVGLQHARLYNGDERIETRDEELALAQSA